MWTMKTLLLKVQNHSVEQYSLKGRSVVFFWAALLALTITANPAVADPHSYGWYPTEPLDYDHHDYYQLNPDGTHVTPAGDPVDYDGWYFSRQRNNNNYHHNYYHHDNVDNHTHDCRHVPPGVPKDKYNCSLEDDDWDRVSNWRDHCPNTPRGVVVDTYGCPFEDRDNDGVHDVVDNCNDTSIFARVNGYGCPVDSDLDGVADHDDDCDVTPRGVRVDEFGCPIDSDSDGVVDGSDKCVSRYGELVDSTGCRYQAIGQVFFDTDKTQGLDDYRSKLQYLKQLLDTNRGATVVIRGHADRRAGHRADRKRKGKGK